MGRTSGWPSLRSGPLNKEQYGGRHGGRVWVWRKAHILPDVEVSGWGQKQQVRMGR